MLKQNCSLDKILFHMLLEKIEMDSILFVIGGY